MSVQRSLLRDAAVWTRGTLATPEVGAEPIIRFCACAGTAMRDACRSCMPHTRAVHTCTQVVAALLRALLPLADRLAALQLVVAETPPLVHGHLSGWAFEAIVLPMHADMQVRACARASGLQAAADQPAIYNLWRVSAAR